MLVAGLLLAVGARAAEPLVVCVAADNPPLSYRAGPGDDAPLRGLDVRLAEAAAQSLGRPLKLLPFESEYEKESTLAQEVAALLSAGLCDAVSGFPLLASDLGTLPRPSARTPGYPGAPRKRERPFVPLQPLQASRAYLAAALGLVLAREVPGVVSLADLARLDDGGTLKLGTTSGTIAGTLALSWRNGVLRKRNVSLTQREDPFAGLADGRYGALLLTLSRFDGYALTHPQSPLRATTWRRPLGINLGFVTLADGPAGAAADARAQVRAAFDRTITDALADGRLARWAAEEGVSWTPPTTPDVGRAPSLLELTAD